MILYLLRTRRVTERLRRYYSNAVERYHRGKDQAGAESEEASYSLGMCAGFMYALIQTSRKDLDSIGKMQAMSMYMFVVPEKAVSGILDVLKDKGEGTGVSRGLPSEMPYKGWLEESWRKGFAKAVEQSYRYFNDMMNYISLRELLFSRR